MKNYNLSPNRQKILETAQAYYRRGNLHPSRQEWRTQTRQNFEYYEGGEGQWLQQDLETIKGRGQVPLTINIIQSRIDNLAGVEIQSRFRTAVRNSSNDPQKDKLSNALTNWLYFVQEDQQIPHKGSLKYRDMLICGVGWSNLYQENGYFYYDHIDPFNVIPDYDDLSPQFENGKYICRNRWMDPSMVAKLWPKAASHMDLSDPILFSWVYSPELIDRQSDYTDIGNYNGYSQSRALVVEVQHKQPKKAYYGIDNQGFYFETFDEEKAEEIANSSNDIDEKESTQIIRTLFLNNYLLETAPLNPDIPGLKDFSYIPCVYKRRFSTGVPYGLVDSMRDIQRDSNVRLTKSIYLANSSRLVISGSIPMETTSVLEEQMKKPDSVIILPKGCEFDLKSNEPLSQGQLVMLHEHENLMKRVTGIYDDLMGQETNATSGVAQKQRQINSVRTHIFSFDNFAYMKSRESKFMLGLLQGGDIENMLSQVIDEDQKETIILNLARTINGKKYIFNDIRTLPVSLEIEEVPDYKNSLDENKAMLENLLSNPNAALIMRSPSLLMRLGFRDYEKLAQEMNESIQIQEGNQAAPQLGQGPQQGNPQNNELMSQSLAYAGM